jgi:hypothetical protein
MGELLDFSASQIIAGLIFGIVGVFFFKAAKQQSHAELYFIGIALCSFQIFITNDFLVWGIGIALTIAGFKILQS